MKSTLYFLVFLCLTVTLSCGSGDDPMEGDKIQVVFVRVGQTPLSASQEVTVPQNSNFSIRFAVPVQPMPEQDFKLTDSDGNPLSFTSNYLESNTLVTLTPNEPLLEGEEYTFVIQASLLGENGENFPGLSYQLLVETTPIELLSVVSDSRTLSTNGTNQNIPLLPTFEVEFSQNVPLEVLQEEIVLVGNTSYSVNVTQQTEQKYTITPTSPLDEFTRINLLFPSSIGTAIGRDFESQSFPLYTVFDEEPDFPFISDEDLLTKVQEQTFKYFWDFAHPASGMARERNTSGNTVTTGGSGFGLMAIIVGVERGFITREEAVERWETVMDFLENADRFHGAWSHWVNGNSGDAIPFSLRDDGGDIVETAFLVQGMLAVRAYLDESNPRENEVIEQITELWEGVEWDWYTRGGGDFIYWHWSPNFDWQMNLPVRGHNETQIIYILAAASPTHPVDPEIYDTGYAQNGNMVNGNTFYDIELPLGYGFGGPLFFAHYSYLGLDPRELKDQYADYWQQNIAHSKINQQYCIDNPGNYVGYSEECWGLTASDGNSGYSAHSPTNDRGVITPTAAISSIPYTPEESLGAIRHFYYDLGDRLWGEYGFYDAFNPTAGWTANSYLAIDQGPIVIMIENYRTGLIWDVFMEDEDVQAGLEKLNIEY